METWSVPSETYLAEVAPAHPCAPRHLCILHIERGITPHIHVLRPSGQRRIRDAVQNRSRRFCRTSLASHFTAPHMKNGFRAPQ